MTVADLEAYCAFAGLMGLYVAVPLSRAEPECMATAVAALVALAALSLSAIAAILAYMHGIAAAYPEPAAAWRAALHPRATELFGGVAAALSVVGVHDASVAYALVAGVTSWLAGALMADQRAHHWPNIGRLACHAALATAAALQPGWCRHCGAASLLLLAA